MATAKPKVSIKLRVAVNEKVVGDWGKLYDDATKVQTVIDWSIQKAAAHMASSLSFEHVEACLFEQLCALARYKSRFPCAFGYITS
jgi:diketogulonate reductase-like aldo/keto reductase